MLQFLGISACGSMFISACGSMSIGLSLGSAIATSFTLAYPELVESLVLVGAGLDG
ncbi:MAG: alpha/beta hydrolase [Coprothermobacterota bacterium]|nr:alpha/beta hydrolase [Coprothermobacterota bacterium]